MSDPQLMTILERLRARLRHDAEIFEDPSSYLDGVNDALDLLAHEVTDGGGPSAQRRSA